MKILHVSESFEGGVASAVSNYVDLTSEDEHFLLCSKRSGRLGSGILGKFSTVSYLTGGHFSAIKTVRDVVDKVKPDVIHCHSSFGGGYARLAYFFRSCPALMVYSPHCYGFERLDVPRVGRWVLYAMEWVLARRTDAVAACSVREKGLAKRLRRKTKVIFVPNEASVRAARSSLPFSKRKNMMVMVGRLCPQKDPAWYAEVAREMDGRVRCVWVGDGDVKYRRVLEEAGVEVTGWVGASEVARILGEAKVYLHTARWEGFPIALLDAERCRVAIVARKASYLEGVRGARTVVRAAEAAEEVEELMGDRERWRKNRERWGRGLAGNSSLVAGRRLREVYGVVVDKKA